MALLLTRMFALLTLVSYLMVGTLAVRFFTAKSASVSFTIDYFSVLKGGALEVASVDVPKAPEQVFADIKFPVQKRVVVARKPAPMLKKPATIAYSNDQKVKIPSLPFHEPVVLNKVVVKDELPSNMIAHYRPAPAEMLAKVDEVSTTMAAAVDEEPLFLDYSVSEEPAEKKEATKEEKVAEVVPEEVQVEDLTVPEYPAEVVNVEAVDKGRGAVDEGRGAVDKGRGAVDNTDDLIAFDYSSVNKAVVDNKIPMITSMDIRSPKKVTTQSSPRKSANNLKNDVNTQKEKGLTKEESEAQGFLARPSSGNESEVIIQLTGTDLKETEEVKGFEVRFLDSMTESLEDYGSGEVTLRSEIAQPVMTRAVSVIKHGFATTTTDLIVESGVSKVSLPVLEAETFNTLQAPYERRGFVGALLVELDDETESASIDVPFGKILKLDGDLKKTKKDDHRYQLFIGVKAGNTMLTYTKANGSKISKITHVKENTMAYESNLYESVSNEKVTLFEEGLLSREKSPLIVGASHVKKFATDVESKKVSDNVYKVNFDGHLLGHRRYLEVSHLDEPVFVGVRDVTKVVVPSEHFMRFVLSKIEGAQLGNRCLVQVNLSKKIEKVEIDHESVDDGLHTVAQMLDTDGKFYDSASDKTRKVIIVGENHNDEKINKNAKINIKINYVDGTVQYLPSYCSPNSYLVEQL